MDELRAINQSGSALYIYPTTLDQSPSQVLTKLNVAFYTDQILFNPADPQGITKGGLPSFTSSAGGAKG